MLEAKCNQASTEEIVVVEVVFFHSGRDGDISCIRVVQIDEVESRSL